MQGHNDDISTNLYVLHKLILVSGSSNRLRLTVNWNVVLLDQVSDIPDSSSDTKVVFSSYLASPCHTFPASMKPLRHRFQVPWHQWGIRYPGSSQSCFSGFGINRRPLGGKVEFFHRRPWLRFAVTHFFAVLLDPFMCMWSLVHIDLHHQSLFSSTIRWRYLNNLSSSWLSFFLTRNLSFFRGTM